MLSSHRVNQCTKTHYISRAAIPYRITVRQVSLQLAHQVNLTRL